MDDRERYAFDLNGYLLVKGILGKDETARALAAIGALEERVVTTVNEEPLFDSLHWKMLYHYDEELGISTYENNHGGGGMQYVIDDFLNADPAFDLFVGHPRTMEYVRDMVEAPIKINSSELRYRHRGNITGTHMGGPMDTRNRYVFTPQPLVEGNRSRPFDLLQVRALYALHDLPVENGPLCVVPGSHKANYSSPYGNDPIKEPGMIPLPMEAGDVLFFTENLRHGGYPNNMDRVRKTVHLCYAPAWVGSQSPAHWDGFVHVTKAAWERYSEEQRAVMPAPAERHPQGPESLSLKRLREQVEALSRRNAELEATLARKGIAGAISRLFPR